MSEHLEAIIAARDEAMSLVRLKQGQRAALDAEIARLTAEVEGFNFYIARHGADDLAVPESSYEEAERWRSMSRVQAVGEALRLMGRPASPGEIAVRLQRYGRNDDARSVSRALDRLLQRGSVKSEGRGQWVLKGVSSQADDGGGGHGVSSSPPLLNGSGRLDVHAVMQPSE